MKKLLICLFLSGFLTACGDGKSDSPANIMNSRVEAAQKQKEAAARKLKKETDKKPETEEPVTAIETPEEPAGPETATAAQSVTEKTEEPVTTTETPEEPAGLETATATQSVTEEKTKEPVTAIETPEEPAGPETTVTAEKELAEKEAQLETVLEIEKLVKEGEALLKRIEEALRKASVSLETIETKGLSKVYKESSEKFNQIEEILQSSRKYLETTANATEVSAALIFIKSIQTFADQAEELERDITSMVEMEAQREETTLEIKKLAEEGEALLKRIEEAHRKAEISLGLLKVKNPLKGQRFQEKFNQIDEFLKNAKTYLKSTTNATEVSAASDLVKKIHGFAEQAEKLSEEIINAQALFLFSG